VSIPIGLLLLCVAMALAVGGLILVQRLVPAELRRQHNDVAGFMYAVLGVVYAVLLGLMVVAAWEEWREAVATADAEANALAEVFYLADRMPEEEGRHVQVLARSYARVVVDEEWQLMEQEESSPKAWDLLDGIRASLQAYEPSTLQDQIVYEQGQERMRDLGDARRERLLEAENGLPTILWVVLIVGGVVVVSFTYLFGLDSTMIHLLMVGSLALIIALDLFTVAALNYPFKGDITVRPEAMEQVLRRFETSRLSDL
jgi:protein-S-isoprenylcysteine O-methyltransferase Ste14